MSIYTKSGDKGETGLLGGKRVSKNTLRIEAIGSIDELNANLGVLLNLTDKASALGILLHIQSQLFSVGACLADPEKKYSKSLSEESVTAMEKYIDDLEARLPKLTNFILPTGTGFATHAHVARAVCRRAERTLIALHEKEPVEAIILKYINRLSDLLFMMAREDMFDKNQKEILWKA